MPRGALRLHRGAKRGNKFSHVFLAMRKHFRSIQIAVLGKKRPWLVWSFNGSPELGRETDAIAESAYTIERRLCVSACDIIIRSAGKVVQPKPDQPDRQLCLCNCTPQESIQAGAEVARRSVKLQLVRVPSVSD